MKFENFEKVDALIAAESELNIMVMLTVDGVLAEAKAGRDFLEKWADAYNANNGIYITAQIVDTEGKTVVATPAVGANGVNVAGESYI